MIAEVEPLRTRALRAGVVCLYDLMLFILIPSLLAVGLGTISPSSPLLVYPFVYEFGAIITSLQALASLTDGSPLSVPFSSASWIVAAYFVWVGASGGSLPLVYDGTSFTFSFQPILFLFMLPLLFNAVREPLEFLLERTEASALISDAV